MNFSLPYDDRLVEIGLRERDGVDVAGLDFPDPLPDIEFVLQRALEEPVGMSPLPELLTPAGRVSVLVPDLTRGAGTADVLGLLLDYLEGAGAGPGRTEIFLAAGMHGRRRGAEISSHLGRGLVSRWGVFEHDATDGAGLVAVGRTPAGTPCRFNSRVVGSSLVIPLGSISFHYFAGFGGGRKMILPGVAGEETIVSNHRLSLKVDPGQGLSEGCRPGNLEGNPVHDDMLAGARLIPCPVFAVNAVFDNHGRVLFLNAGELERSHRGACGYLSERFLLSNERRYRAVILSAGGRPRDIDLLQSHKALRLASYAVEKGGLLLAVLACPEGIGSSSLEYSVSGGIESVPEKVRLHYTLNAQAAMSTYELVTGFSIYVKSMLGEKDLSRFGLGSWREDETDRLLSGIPDEDILVLPYASYFLPEVRGTIDVKASE